MQYMPGGFYASIYNQTANLSSYPVLTSPETITNSPLLFNPYYFNPATYVCPAYQQPIRKTGRLIGMCGLPTGESCNNCCSFNVCLCSPSNVYSFYPLSNWVGLLHIGPEVLRLAHVSLWVWPNMRRESVAFRWGHIRCSQVIARKCAIRKIVPSLFGKRHCRSYFRRWTRRVDKWPTRHSQSQQREGNVFHHR